MACAQDIMSRDLITVKADTLATEAMEIILQKRISGLPVVSDDMSLLGILSEKDLLNLTFYDSIDEAKVSDVMTKDVISMPEETELLDICDFFLNNNYKRLPIVSNKKLIGIVSRKDVLRFILKNKK